jgi:hypothetical protein
VEIADESCRVAMVIIPCQTSTVQDFIVQKFSKTSRGGVRPSLTLGTQDFMTKEERSAAVDLCAIYPNIVTTGARRRYGG